MMADDKMTPEKEESLLRNTTAVMSGQALEKQAIDVRNKLVELTVRKDDILCQKARGVQVPTSTINSLLEQVDFLKKRLSITDAEIDKRLAQLDAVKKARTPVRTRGGMEMRRRNIDHDEVPEHSAAGLPVTYDEFEDFDANTPDWNEEVRRHRMADFRKHGHPNYDTFIGRMRKSVEDGCSSFAE